MRQPLNAVAEAGSGEVDYGFGLSIYIAVPCARETPVAGRMRLAYAAPTGERLARGFVLTDSNRIKKPDVALTEAQVAGPRTSYPND